MPRSSLFTKRFQVSLGTEEYEEMQALIRAGVFWSPTHVFTRCYEYWKLRHKRAMEEAFKIQEVKKKTNGTAEGSEVHE